MVPEFYPVTTRAGHAFRDALLTVCLPAQPALRSPQVVGARRVPEVDVRRPAEQPVQADAISTIDAESKWASLMSGDSHFSITR